GNLLSHLVSPVTTNNVKCAHFLLDGELIDPEKREQVFNAALQEAILNQHTKAIKVLMGYKFLNERERMMQEYAMTQMKQQSKSEQLLSYLRKETTELEFGIIMRGLQKTMLAMVKDGGYLTLMIGSGLKSMWWRIGICCCGWMKLKNQMSNLKIITMI
ncbi:hypothetical protein RFI_21235, partial [Reticulomyxa filosa]